MKGVCGMDPDERRGCEFYFPAGPWDDDCMHRDPSDGHCGNKYAREKAPRGNEKAVIHR